MYVCKVYEHGYTLVMMFKCGDFFYIFRKYTSLGALIAFLADVYCYSFSW